MLIKVKTYSKESLTAKRANNKKSHLERKSYINSYLLCEELQYTKDCAAAKKNAF